MTKSTTRFGMFGIAAIVAILSISLIATNLTTQEATAEAARKTGLSMNNLEIAGAISAQSTVQPFAQDIGTMYLKSNDKGDWMVEGVIECATAIQAKASGKHAKDDPLSGGTAGAKVWVEMDGKPISIATGEPTKDITEAQWNLCQQTFEMKSNFNDLIISCEEAVTIDPTFAACWTGADEDGDGLGDTLDSTRLVFLCDVDSTETECAQSLEVFTKVAGTHPIAVMLHNVAAGDSHEIIVYAELSAGPSENSTLYESEIIESTENFVDAGVVLGKRLFSVETLSYQG
jgi:hypothetical protein